MQLIRFSFFLLLLSFCTVCYCLVSFKSLVCFSALLSFTIFDYCIGIVEICSTSTDPKFIFLVILWNNFQLHNTNISALISFFSVSFLLRKVVQIPSSWRYHRSWCPVPLLYLYIFRLATLCMHRSSCSIPRVCAVLVYHSKSVFGLLFFSLFRYYSFHQATPQSFQEMFLFVL